MVDPGAVLGVVGTYLLLAAFLSLTAAVAARNVLGDVELERGLLVGPVPAAVSFLLFGGFRLAGGRVEGQFQLYPFLVLAVALVADYVALGRAFDCEGRLAAYVTGIHLVVSVIMGAVLGGVLFLASTAP
jgi:hypothetical protein